MLMLSEGQMSDHTGAKLLYPHLPAAETLIADRNADGTHDFAATDAEFDSITSHFVPPSEQEGFETIVYRGPDAKTKH
jgi:hypothetical protein